MTATAAAHERRLVTVAKAAEYADVHPMTVRRWIATGRVRAYRLSPRTTRIDLNELDAALRPLPESGAAHE